MYVKKKEEGAFSVFLYGETQLPKCCQKTDICHAIAIYGSSVHFEATTSNSKLLANNRLLPSYCHRLPDSKVMANTPLLPPFCHPLLTFTGASDFDPTHHDGKVLPNNRHLPSFCHLQDLDYLGRASHHHGKVLTNNNYLPLVESY